MYTTKEFSCSKYDKHYYHKNVSPQCLKYYDEKIINKYNNIHNTSATIKHPFYCPSGRHCKSCHHSRKGFMKNHNLVKLNMD